MRDTRTVSFPKNAGAESYTSQGTRTGGYIDCPHHPKDVSWWWSQKCGSCADGDRSSRTSTLRCAEDSDSGLLEYRFGRWTHVSAHPVSTLRLPPIITDDIKQLLYPPKRERRHLKANKRHPARFARRGSDTNLDRLTGKSLYIRREGLLAIGRSFESAKTTNSSGQVWRC